MRNLWQGAAMLALSLGLNQAQAVPEACKPPGSVAAKVNAWAAKHKGFHKLAGNQPWHCSRSNEETCCQSLYVDVTVDPKDPNKCVATLPYSVLTIDVKRRFSPKLVWTIRKDPSDKADYEFDPNTGIQLFLITDPGPPPKAEPLPVKAPFGHDGAGGQKFKWKDTGKFGLANHEAVIYIKGSNPQIKCEPKDPGIVNAE